MQFIRNALSVYSRKPSRSNRKPAALISRASACIEGLEGRVFLSATAWKAPVSGNWDDASNWTNGVPGVADDASITVDGTYTVTMGASGESVNSLTLGGASGVQSVTGAWLTLGAASTISSTGQLNITNGGIAGAGSLTNQGNLSVNAGTINCALVNSGTFTTVLAASVTGSFTSAVGSDIEITLPTNVPPVGSLGLTFKSGFTNNGTIDIASDPQGVYSMYLTALGTGLVNAAGGYVVIAPSSNARIEGTISNYGTLTVHGNVTIDPSNADSINAGLIDCSNGNLTIALAADHFLNSGAVRCGSGHVVTVNTEPDVSAGIFYENAGGSFAGSGSINFDFATLWLNTSLTDSGLTLWANNTISGPGTLTIASSGLVTLTGFCNSTLVNDGTLISYDATVNNTVDNEGTLIVRSFADYQVPTLIKGTLTSGPRSNIQIDGPTTAGATLELTSAFTNNGTINLSGALKVDAGTLTNGTGGFIYATGTGAPAIAGNVINSGRFSPESGTIGLTLTGNYAQTATGYLDVALSSSTYSPMSVSGTTTLAGTAVVFANNGYVPTVGQTVDVIHDAVITGSVNVITRPPAYFIPSYTPDLILTDIPTPTTPVAQDDSASPTANTPIAINVLANDSDPNSGAVLDPTTVIASTPGHGTVAVNPQTGVITYTPASGFLGQDSFSYTVKDSLGAMRNVATVTISVQPQRYPPQAGNILLTLRENSSDAYNELLSTSDPNFGGSINDASVKIVTGPTHGTTTLDPTTGIVTYTPNVNYVGTDSYSYTVNDNFGLTSNVATVSLNVTNLSPLALNESDTALFNTPLLINEIANDSDPISGGSIDPTTVQLQSNPSHGTATVNPTTGKITYTPTTGFFGNDSFTYDVMDDFGFTSNVATVSLIVKNHYQAPVAASTNTSLLVNTSFPINVLALDYDPNAGGAIDPTTVKIGTAAAHGTLAVNRATGILTYTPATDYLGPDSFTYTVSDNFAQTSNVATVSITVSASHPSADNVSATINSNTAFLFNEVGNATDPNSGGKIDPTTVQIGSYPAHGTVVVNSTTGGITYTPAAAYSGPDSFTYTLKDNFGLTSNVATVNIIIRATPKPPVAVSDSVTTAINTPVLITELANDSDPNAGGSLNPKTVKIITPPAKGTAAVDPVTGNITYTPGTGYMGTYTFTYTVSDNLGLTSGPATVSVNIPAATHKPPVAVNDTVSTAINTASVISVLSNDSDSNTGGSLVPSSLVIGTQPAHGKVTINTSTGQITYTPTTGYTGADSFTYSVKDNFGLTSNIATVAITVAAAAKKPPVAVNDTAKTTAGNALVISPLANDSDPNTGGSLVPSSLVIATQPAHGKLVINASTGQVTYTPTAGYTGSDSFTYSVKDSFGLSSNIATVAITVSASTGLKPPVAVNTTGRTPANTPDALAELYYDSDPNPGGKIDITTVKIVSQPVHGTVSVSTVTGRITYIPATNYKGTDTFSYTVKDNFGLTSNVATITMTVL